MMGVRMERSVGVDLPADSITSHVYNALVRFGI
jgi:hypothetical protein